MMAAILLSVFCEQALAGEIRVTVEGCSAGNSVHAALYDSARGFAATDGRLAFRTVQVPGASLTLSFANLPPGHYALAVFCDLNANSRLDRNLFGRPTEPYGFSREARGLLS